MMKSSGDFDQLRNRILELSRNRQRVIIGIDGPCGSGKTTLAGRLKEALPSCAVIHTDDFFLQPSMRTVERLAEPGGNMDRERLYEEVMKRAGEKNGFTYRKYDCQTGAFSPVDIREASILIVEGSYSLHPDLASHYDLTIFLNIDPEEQLNRLEKRVGKERLSRFVNEWIPLENRYFQALGIASKADIRLSSKAL